MIRFVFVLLALVVLCQGGLSQSRPTLLLIPADEQTAKLMQPVIQPLEDDLHIHVEIEAPDAFMKTATFSATRQQYDASYILDDIQNRFGGRYVRHQTILIAVTTNDLYSSGFDWNYVFGIYKKSASIQSAILSTARMEQSFYAEADAPDVRNDRLSKMLTRYVCLQLFEQKNIDDDNSVLRPSIMSTSDLDTITQSCHGHTQWKEGPFAEVFPSRR